jgi:hypothetical protein
VKKLKISRTSRFNENDKKKTITQEIFFGSDVLPSIAVSYKLNFKTARNLDQYEAVSSIFLSKIAFSSNLFNGSYFKKQQTAAFQIKQDEALSPRLLRLSKSSSKLDKFELIKPRTVFSIPYVKQKARMVKNLCLINVSAFLDNFLTNCYSTLRNSPFSKHNELFDLYAMTPISSKSNIIIRNSHKTQVSLLLQYLLRKTRKCFLNPYSITQLFPHVKTRPSLFTKNQKKNNFLFLLQKKINLWEFSFFFSKILFLKMFIKFSDLLSQRNVLSFYNFSLQTHLKSFFYSRNNSLFKTNILPNFTLFHTFKKKILKLFSYDKFSPSGSPFYINSLIRFFEHCSGKGVVLKSNMFLNNFLSYKEKAQCFNWSLKVKVFRKMLGPRLFLAESLEILYLAFKLKDPFFLSNWLLNMMKKISFWKYRLFFRYLKYSLRYFFVPIFKDLNVKGIKFRLKGKISVAGNARTRTILQRTGVTGHSSFKNKVVQELSLVKSFTGVMGLKVWIFF